MGIDDLLEMVLLVAEVKELKANPNRDARGVIVEAKLDKGRGPVATVLVQNGTLRIGDSVVCGTTYGKVRAMINDRGENVKKAGPSVPVEILGLNDVPEAGDILAALEEKQARSIAEARIERKRNNLIKSKKSRSMISSIRSRKATSKTSTSSSRRMCRVLSKLCRVPCSSSTRTMRSAFPSFTRASVPSTNRMSCWPRLRMPHHRVQCPSGCQCTQAGRYREHRYPHVPRHL